jgi:hypothetical protein
MERSVCQVRFTGQACLSDARFGLDQPGELYDIERQGNNQGFVL